MGQVLGDLLPLAVGIALSPIPIVAAILMILSRNAGGAAKGFAAGWVLGILLVTVIVTLVSGSLSDESAQEPSAVVSWIKIVLGAGLIVLAVRQWQARADTAVPAWMQAIDSMTTAKATGLGALLSGVNPKNLLLGLSAGLVIGGAGLGTGATITAVVVFTLLASSTVLAVVLGYLVAADRLRPTLNSLREWLQANNHAVMAIVLVVMGAVVLGKGIGGL
ncbi:GAP family protein [Nocardia asteroides]|uniref:GAP family protein n=1 Tax=Nocardia asteroides TaxID=1824 RepID=UPI001E3595EF|nr:GAP family protein [Nocardia asteroides]UGT57321.1 GAP family protein [Nocardia asteroides]